MIGHVRALGTAKRSLRTALAESRAPQYIPCFLALCALVIYTVWSLSLHDAFQSSGQDLGLFEQAVRAYADGHWPTADLKGPDILLLGDHFSPILALLAVSVIPVTRSAISRSRCWLSPVSGCSVGSGGGRAVAFAVPLVLVKEDLPMTGAMLGLYLVGQGQRRLRTTCPGPSRP